jgi:alkylhydroperoxidase family enzyme
MTTRRFWICLFSATLFSSAPAVADEAASNQPKSVPATRPDIKAALEALKDRQPRLPLPPASEGEPSVNNGRMRALYLPESWASGGSRPQQPGQPAGVRWRRDPNARLDYALTRACFWVVSRGNNCHYCLGHQELALRHAGYDDDKVAAIDSDWAAFDPRQQAALRFARELTLEPQLVNDDDIKQLKKVFTDAEIIELTYNIARFNATNRWTDGLGIPQDRRFGEETDDFTTPTSDNHERTTSIVAPATRASRPPLPTLSEVEEALEDAALRLPRVKLPTDDEARKALTDIIGKRKPEEWERALSQLPVTGPSQVATINAIMDDEHLSPRLKAEISLISAVHNRAWCAVSFAVNRLIEQGVTHEDMVIMFEGDAASSPADAAAHRLAVKSTVNPHLISDADIADVRKHFSDAETAQIVQVICMANFFDRFTEALGLTIE